MDDAEFQRIQHISKYGERIAGTIERYGRNYDIFSDDDYFDSISMKIMQIVKVS